jgi:hypothetical protein
MEAAAGYLLVGFAGGIALISLQVLEPAAFNLPSSLNGLPGRIAHVPTLVGAAFGWLTTLGSPVLRLDHLTALTTAVAIGAVGQLYVTILIAGALGKPRQLATLRKAAARRSTPRRVAARVRRPSSRPRCHGLRVEPCHQARAPATGGVERVAQTRADQPTQQAFGDELSMVCLQQRPSQGVGGSHGAAAGHTHRDRMDLARPERC